MRCEILEEVGGFIQEAGSICLRVTDELWDKPDVAYTVHKARLLNLYWFHLFWSPRPIIQFSLLAGTSQTAK
jgi:hypothetical protein